jgi:RNA polymerase-binding transcription factor DksA
MDNKIDTKKYESALKKELAVVEGELQTVGRINPDNPKDWQPTPEPMDTHRSESDEVADNIEAFEENTAVLKQLEIRYNEIKTSLEKIKEGTYGICEIGGEMIDEKRLEANPAAKTCIAHSK